MDTLPTLYKIVGPNGEPLNGGSGLWPLPTDTEPGAWRTITGPLEACRNGLHLASAEQVARWLPPDHVPHVVYRAETRGEVQDAGGKYVAAAVRLMPRRVPAGTPDLAAESARCTAALRRASRAEDRAAEAVRRSVPPGWAGYLDRVRDPRFPAGHPAAARLAPYRAALAEQDRVNARTRRARAAAQARYAAARLAAVLPE